MLGKLKIKQRVAFCFGPQRSCFGVGCIREARALGVVVAPLFNQKVAKKLYPWGTDEFVVVHLQSVRSLAEM